MTLVDINVVIIITISSIQRCRLIDFVYFSALQRTLLEAVIKLPTRFNLLFAFV